MVHAERLNRLERRHLLFQINCIKSERKAGQIWLQTSNRCNHVLDKFDGSEFEGLRAP